MFKKFLQYIGLAPTQEDKELKELIDNSYKSLRVVGRGTGKIDPSEVRQSKEWKEAKGKARAILESAEETYQVEKLREKIVRDAMDGKPLHADLQRLNEIERERFMPRKLQE